MNFLVVDDEPSQRRGFANMLKRLRPDHAVYQAKNGTEALELFNSTQVDVLFTDVKMPLMSGLELAEKIRHTGSNTKIVIFSGYRKFEYAQKAIGLNVFDYVLKIVDEEKLEEIVKRLEEAISKERKEARTPGEDRSIHEMLPVYQSHKLNKWLNGYSSASELEDIGRTLQYGNTGILFVTKISRFSLLKEKYSNEEIHNIRFSIYSIVQDTVAPQGYSTSFYLEDSKSTLVTVLNAESALFPDSGQIPGYFERIVHLIRQKHDLQVHIGVSPYCGDLRNEVSEYFKKASAALSYKFYPEMGNVILYPAVSSYAEGSIKSKHGKNHDAFLQAIRKLEAQKARELVRQMLQDLIRQKYPMPGVLIEHTLDFLIYIVNDLQNLIDESTAASIIEHCKKAFYTCESIEELGQELDQTVDRILAALESDKSLSNMQMIQETLTFIERNYMNNISLESIAEAFHFNSSYFSTMFKKHTGTNFTDYLSRIRLEKARELLVQSDKRIYDIAGKIGYNDVKYFNKVFKKEYGLTPEEFRRKARVTKIR